MYQNFYQKYRPQKFSEIIGQDEIVAILKSSLLQNKIHHAYLFDGMHGTGKTSTARIMAKAINCENITLGEPCETCKICQKFPNIDVIEIDGASNNGVEQIRSLKEVAVLSPMTSKYKIYIIDEVHMLTKAAFNAFLKILEEPPKHVIFIMATTEIHKIIATILSRCQIFHFQKLTSEKLTLLLQKIAKKEHLNFTKESLKLINKYSDGSVRDALNTLEQIGLLHSEKIIRKETILKHFGFLSDQEHQDFVYYLLKNDILTIKKLQERFFKNNLNYKNLTEKMLIIFKDIFLQTIEGKEEGLQKDIHLPKEKLQKIVNYLLNSIPTFNYQISHRLIFEITCLEILQIINKKKENTETKSKDYLKIEITNEKILNTLKKRNQKIFNNIKKHWKDWKFFENHTTWKEIVSIIQNGRILTASQDEVILIFDKKSDCDFINEHQKMITDGNLSQQLFEKKLIFYAITNNKAQVIKEKFQEEKNKK